LLPPYFLKKIILGPFALKLKQKTHENDIRSMYSTDTTTGLRAFQGNGTGNRPAVYTEYLADTSNEETTGLSAQQNGVSPLASCWLRVGDGRVALYISRRGP
jgi:hypothetical protein